MPAHARTTQAIAAALPADVIVVRHALVVVGLIATLVVITSGGAMLQ